MTLLDQLKDQVAAAGYHGQVSDLIDDQQGKAAVEPDLLAQRALAFGLGECADGSVKNLGQPTCPPSTDRPD